MKGMLLHFINRVLNPTVLLKTPKEIETFFDQSKEYNEENEFYLNKFEGIGSYFDRMGLHVRVVAFFNDKKEYKNEFKLFQRAAQKLAVRDDLRIGYTTDKEVIRYFKEKYSVKWFDEYSHNSIVISRSPGVFEYYNIEDTSEDIDYWINKHSLSKRGDDYNRETAFISKLLG